MQEISTITQTKQTVEGSPMLLKIGVIHNRWTPVSASKLPYPAPNTAYASLVATATWAHSIAKSP